VLGYVAMLVVVVAAVLVISESTMSLCTTYMVVMISRVIRVLEG
jgi:hypothetical protein